MPNYEIRIKPNKERAMKIEHLVALADAYSAHSDLKLTTIGVYAVNDGKFFERLKAGGGCTIKTANNVLNWFNIIYPADLEWPADIPRPPRSKKEAA